MKLSFKHREYSDRTLNKSLSTILAANKLCAIATTLDHRRSYIHTAYFAYTDELDLFFLSNPTTRHCRNIAEQSNVAVAIYDSHQSWEDSKKGLQMFGRCFAAVGNNMDRAEYNYGKRFPAYRDWIGSLTAAEKHSMKSRFYIIKIRTMKIFDEPLLGEEVFVSATIR